MPTSNMVVPCRRESFPRIKGPPTRNCLWASYVEGRQMNTLLHLILHIRSRKNLLTPHQRACVRIIVKPKVQSELHVALAIVPPCIKRLWNYRGVKQTGLGIWAVGFSEGQEDSGWPHRWQYHPIDTSPIKPYALDSANNPKAHSYRHSVPKNSPNSPAASEIYTLSV